MTTLVRTDIPASITTVEQLAAWCSAVLAFLNPQATVFEATNIEQKVALSASFQYFTQGAYAYRFVGRVSLPLDSTFLGNGKIWTKCQELSTTAVPTDFKS